MYKILNSDTGAPSCIKRLSDNAFIPMDEQNSDYATYLQWLSEGNTPISADEVTE